jgi:hypothetical protein
MASAAARRLARVSILVLIAEGTCSPRHLSEHGLLKSELVPLFGQLR